MPDDRNDNTRLPGTQRSGDAWRQEAHAYGLAVFYFGLRASGLRLL